MTTARQTSAANPLAAMLDETEQMCEVFGRAARLARDCKERIEEAGREAAEAFAELREALGGRLAALRGDAASFLAELDARAADLATEVGEAYALPAAPPPPDDDEAEMRALLERRDAIVRDGLASLNGCGRLKLDDRLVPTPDHLPDGRSIEKGECELVGPCEPPGIVESPPCDVTPILAAEAAGATAAEVEEVANLCRQIEEAQTTAAPPAPEPKKKPANGKKKERKK